jgi:hypothetical protein
VKAFFITPPTNETDKHYESFLSLPGNEVQRHVYFNTKRADSYENGRPRDDRMFSAALSYMPDVIIYIGACGDNLPEPGILRKLRDRIAPTVHLCSDAADDPWWPLLMEYDRIGAFSVQVALDGNPAWPLAETQITALTTLDPKWFARDFPRHAERPIGFGFAGNIGVVRAALLERAATFGLQYRERDGARNSYAEYVDYLGRCRIVLNFARTGSLRHMQVKGRVIEAALAGAMLLEERGAPTSHWFTPGVDYLEYGSMEEAASILAAIHNRPVVTEAIAGRLREKVRADHSPAAFWRRVMERIQIKETV